MECSCRLWPRTGDVGGDFGPEVRRTRATLRRAEFGFFGVVVYTRVHTPRRCGLPFRAGPWSWRPCRCGPCGPAAGWWALGASPSSSFLVLPPAGPTHAVGCVAPCERRTKPTHRGWIPSPELPPREPAHLFKGKQHAAGCARGRARGETVPGGGFPVKTGVPYPLLPRSAPPPLRRGEV